VPVNAPFQNPAEGRLVEIEVIEPGHPLFGRRFPVVSVSRPRATSEGGHALVAHQGRVLLRLPLAATSLAARPLSDGGRSKLTAEAAAELVALAEDSEVAACSSGPNASGDAPPRRCGARSPMTSQPSSRR
jgi:hypothetical protein